MLKCPSCLVAYPGPFGIESSLQKAINSQPSSQINYGRNLLFLHQSRNPIEKILIIQTGFTRRLIFDLQFPCTECHDWILFLALSFSRRQIFRNALLLKIVRGFHLVTCSVRSKLLLSPLSRFFKLKDGGTYQKMSSSLKMCTKNLHDATHNSLVMGIIIDFRNKNYFFTISR